MTFGAFSVLAPKRVSLVDCSRPFTREGAKCGFDAVLRGGTVTAQPSAMPFLSQRVLSTTSVAFLGLASILMTACPGGNDGAPNHPPMPEAGVGADAGDAAVDSGPFTLRSDPSAPLPLDQFATAMANVICASEVPCCSSAGVAAQAALCLANETQRYKNVMTREQASHATYDEALAGQCYAAWAKHVGNCTMTVTTDPGDALSGNGGVCNLAWRGTVQLGQECHWGDDCARSTQGISFCTADWGAKGVCALYVSEGGECKDTQCGTGLFCAAGVCKKPTPKGSACDSSAAQDICDKDLWCNPATMQCEALPAVGASCNTIRGCGAGGWCDSTTFTCVAKGKWGDSCGNDSQCDNGYCGSPTPICTAKLPVKSACKYGDECSSGFCVQGMCAPDGDNLPVIMGCDDSVPPPADAGADGG